MKKRANFNFNHGVVMGVYVYPLHDSGPLVVIVNGHNGFYAYGMFPYIQDALAEKGISSYSFNFSHGGVKDDEDYFTDLTAYEKNCMRLEQLDLLEVLRNLDGSGISKPQKGGVFLLSHSLGSVPLLFGAHEALRSGVEIAGAIMMAPLKTLDVFPKSMMDEWEKTGVYYMKNNRTGQALPQGPEFLSEIKASTTTWNVERAIKETPLRYLLVHGAEDKDVPIEHSEALKQWAEEAEYDVTLRVIQKAGHTFNTSHPFKCKTPELDVAIETIQDWIMQRQEASAR
jgi:predicted alpha/beta hydrolase family esterase